ncbi:MinD/ParA family protein [Halothermothrix orenii]|uniref:Cobyrinic acid ac-diamide synthase n=1 Tax=Halothermothrix orenii (strain H 168 / OCM 544 / DSM 9562) TaxID=373903 RepID=B8CYP7_HALOH|nr:MinD/ParA family protein [Halothermothrix orenii]ACL70416.1 Cobyrinic acid ac-diamide synthase [Halothermothrix orenii H 168]
MVDQATRLRKLVKAKEIKGSETRVIAIASGKGGVGKTNVAVNLGLALQKKGKRVLLLDADLGMANVDILLGLTPKYNLNHVLKGKCDFYEALLEGPEGLHVLPGTSGVEDLINISSREVNRLIETFNQMEENYDIILIDVGAGIHYSVINFIMGCDEVVVVLTPEPTAVMDAYSLIKIMANHGYNRDISLLINQVSNQQEGDKVTGRMTKVIEEYLGLDVRVMGYIPFDEHIRQAVKAQQAVVHLYPGSKAGKAFSGIAERVLNQTRTKKPKGMKGFVSKIIGIIGRN